MRVAGDMWQQTQAQCSACWARELTCRWPQQQPAVRCRLGRCWRSQSAAWRAQPQRHTHQQTERFGVWHAAYTGKATALTAQGPQVGRKCDDDAINQPWWQASNIGQEMRNVAAHELRDKERLLVDTLQPWFRLTALTTDSQLRVQAYTA